MMTDFRVNYHDVS